MTGPNPILEQLVREHASPPQPEARPVTVTRILQDVASNPLITRLAEHNLGRRLADHEADHICRLVAIIESGRHGERPGDVARDLAHDGLLSPDVAERVLG